MSNDTCISGFAPINDTIAAGAGWRYAQDYWPYQLHTFISPPYAGYVSGHAAFARAGAEVLTSITGDSYFPGGLHEFECVQNDFLVFENGPSETIRLQWATYQDAADQAALSRILGGICSPYDELAGRIIGHEVGSNSFELAEEQFFGTAPIAESVQISDHLITDEDEGTLLTISIEYDQAMDTELAPTISFDNGAGTFAFSNGGWLNDTAYQASYAITDQQELNPNVNFEITGGSSVSGLTQSNPLMTESIHIDMLNPGILSASPSETLIDASLIGVDSFSIQLTFDDDVDQDFTPLLSFPAEDPSATLTLSTNSSGWISPSTYEFVYSVNEGLSTIDFVHVEASNVFDTVGNPIEDSILENVFAIDIASSLSDHSISYMLDIYPNPVRKGRDITVSVENALTEGVIRFTSPLGQVIQDWSINELPDHKLHISTQGLSTGMYTIDFIVGAQQSRLRVVISD